MEGREVGPGPADGALQEGRRTYFVSMGSHHDNFYLWNSKLHKWNAVNMGPKRDVVGDWQKAAKKHGLRFGVSEHLGASFTWFQASHGADKTGPQAGVPYDGADPKYQDLYHFPAEPGDTGWYSNNPRGSSSGSTASRNWWTTTSPTCSTPTAACRSATRSGRSLIAHLYNADAARHGGKPEVVYTCKQQSEGRWVEDLERGVMPRINPDPWQTDTSIGDWYYNKNWKFRAGELDDPHAGGHRQQERQPAAERRAAARRLARSRSRAGARSNWPPGSPSTAKPSTARGPGWSTAKARSGTKGGHFKEDFTYTAKDIRFTTKGDDALRHRPGLAGRRQARGPLAGRRRPARSTGVSLLGHDGKLDVEADRRGPGRHAAGARRSREYTCALKITGEDLKPAPIPEVADRRFSPTPRATSR